MQTPQSARLLAAPTRPSRVRWIPLGVPDQVKKVSVTSIQSFIYLIYGKLLNHLISLNTHDFLVIISAIDVETKRSAKSSFKCGASA